MSPSEPAAPLTAAIVGIGDELLSGRTVDRNSAWLAARLLALDVPTERVVVVGDEERTIAAAFRELAASHALVFATGGLGPTPDDLTRHAAALAAGVELVRSEPAREEIERWFARRGVAMVESNLRQALVPAGATVLLNRRGTAPGFGLRVGAARLFSLPGPPLEVQAMFEHEVLPLLLAELPPRPALARASFSLFGLSESVFAERAAEWLVRGDNPEMGVTVSGGVLTATLTARPAEGAPARAILAPRLAAFRERFAAHVYSETGETLEQSLARAALEGGRRLALAESCTGGLATALLTRVPGVSAALLAGWVTYTNEAKTRDLGVDAELLGRHGAVSSRVAAAMAAGAAARSGADLAVSVTGVAGPDGGTEEKPVGLVWFGLSDRGRVTTHERRFPPVERNRIRELAARTALFLLLRACRGGEGG